MTYHAKTEAVVTLSVSKSIQLVIPVMTLSTTFPAVPVDTLVLPRISGNAVEVILKWRTHL